MYVYYSLAHRDFWKHTKHGWNFFLLKVGRTLIQSFAHLRQTWVLVEGHIGAVLKQLEANAVSNIASHHLNLLKVSLFFQSVGQQKKMHTVNEIAGLESVTKSCKFEVYKLKTIWKRQIDEAKCSHMMVIRSESEAKRTASRQHH